MCPAAARIFQAPIRSHDERRWAEVTATGQSKSSQSIFLAAQKSGLPAAFMDKAKAVIAPGTTLIFTDRPVDPTTQSAPTFQILVAQKDKPVKT